MCGSVWVRGIKGKKTWSVWEQGGEENIWTE
jgi:hypothetical protein